MNAVFKLDDFIASSNVGFDRGISKCVEINRQRLIYALQHEDRFSFSIVDRNMYCDIYSVNKFMDLLNVERDELDNYIIILDIEKNLNFDTAQHMNEETIKNSIVTFQRKLVELIKNGYSVGAIINNPLIFRLFKRYFILGILPYGTTESQIHREFVSALDIPIGFECEPSRSIQSVINGIKTASQPHSFIGVNSEGQVCKIISKGNPLCYIVVNSSITIDFVKDNPRVKYFNGAKKILNFS
ncbi:hypothetical protein WAB73_003338 [Salmonella enterica subsp. enterica]